jgi:hypothetical protein
MKKKLFIILLIVIILELTLFNINSYRVLNNNSKKEFTEEDFIYSEDDEYRTYIEIDNINTEVKTVHIELDIEYNVKYRVLYADETSSNLKGMPQKEYVIENENSKYIPCYLSGESSKIAIEIQDENVKIEKVTINEKIPFHFNLARVIIVYGIIAFIYLLKTREIFKIPYSENNFKQEIILNAILCVFLIIICFLSNYSRDQVNIYYDFYSRDFVLALSKGQVHLEEVPNEDLVNLDNPYDFGQRTANGLLKDRDYIWDAVYYNGNYYVYFGILPALVLMLPYYKITGNLMTTQTAVMIFSIFAVICLLEILRNIFKRFFKKVPFKYMVFSLMILLFGSQILWLNGIPRFYELAIISALFFASLRNKLYVL